MKIDSVFDIADSEYWSDPWRNRKIMQGPYMQKGEPCLLIGSPNKMALNNKDRFPVALLQVSKLSSIKSPSLKESAIVVALNRLTHELIASEVFLPVMENGSQAASSRKSSNTSSGKDSFSNDESAMASDAHCIDLFKRLRLPAERSEYLINVIMLDEISNRSQTKLIESEAYEDTAVEAYMQTMLSDKFNSNDLTSASDAPYIDYQITTQSPEIPLKAGVDCLVKRVNVIESKACCDLNISFKLPVVSTIDSADTQDKYVDSQENQSSLTATAIVPLSILITGSVIAKPYVINLMAASYNELTHLNDKMLATGYVTLDLNKFYPSSKIPQTCFIYIFSGEVIEGPIPMAFINPPR